MTPGHRSGPVLPIIIFVKLIISLSVSVTMSTNYIQIILINQQNEVQGKCFAHVPAQSVLIIHLRPQPNRLPAGVTSTWGESLFYTDDATVSELYKIALSFGLLFFFCLVTGLSRAFILKRHNKER